MVGPAASRTGISEHSFGADMPQTLEVMNRPVYEARLVRSWLPALPDVVARLQAGGRALDVGCGTGIVPITLARAYPKATIAGLDLDARSIAIARAYALEAELGEWQHEVRACKHAERDLLALRRRERGSAEAHDLVVE